MKYMFLLAWLTTISIFSRQHEDMMDRLRESGPDVEARNAASEAEVADRDERALQTYLRLQRRRSDSGASTIDREQYGYDEDEEQSTVDEERVEEGSGILCLPLFSPFHFLTSLIHVM